MATPHLASAVASSPDTPISIKVTIDGSNRKFKLPLRDLTAAAFAARLRSVLQLPADQTIVLERFSDSSGSFVTLDTNNPSSYKQLYRAAKAKLKLRLRVSSPEPKLPSSDKPATESSKASSEVSTQPKSLATPPSQGSSANISLPSDESCRANVASVKVPAQSPGSKNAARDKYFNELAKISKERSLGLRMREAPPPQVATNSWQVCCNNCDKTVSDIHYHCSTCDNGDYDLCETCVAGGVVCRGEGHWLIKRSIQNGSVINSTTEKLIPKRRADPQSSKEMPGSFNGETKPVPEDKECRRTCNSCVRVLPEKILVSCSQCEDYDLCVPCVLEGKHGHHPAHTLEPISKEMDIPDRASNMCVPGRGQRHRAICDGCQKTIFGIRHKCLDCPDFDFCGACVEDGRRSHGHRFVPVYEPLPEPSLIKERHFGIYCDGPQCENEAEPRYIVGTRYKCAICEDTDFCANCEAHPSNKHNKTHPLIKFNTMVRDVSISTVAESSNGQELHKYGDREPHGLFRQPSVATLPPYTAADPLGGQTINTPKISSKPETTSNVTSKSNSMHEAEREMGSARPHLSFDLDARFEADSVPDGTVLTPGKLFVQTWTMHNPGPLQWPTGCSLRFTGGDHMLNLDRARPNTFATMSRAQESNRTVRQIPQGQKASFCVSLRAPAQDGKFVSYWRMIAPDGTPFGHKVWCDIQVKSQSRPVSGSHASQEAANLRARLHALSTSLERSTRSRTTDSAAALESTNRQTDVCAAPLPRTHIPASCSQPCCLNTNPVNAATEAPRWQSDLLTNQPPRSPYFNFVRDGRAKPQGEGPQKATEETRPKCFPTRQTMQSGVQKATQNPREPTLANLVLPTTDRTILDALPRPMMSSPQQSGHNFAQRKPCHGGSALADYEMQLMLLEKRNKERLLMAQANDQPTVEELMHLEEQNKKRFLMARAANKPTEVEESIAGDSIAKQNGDSSSSAAGNGAMVFPTLEKESQASSVAQSKNATGDLEAVSAPEDVLSMKDGESANEKGKAGECQKATSSFIATETTASTEMESDHAIEDDVKAVDSMDDELSDNNDDDGFLTDEEYDILDASDEEIINGGTAGPSKP